MNIRSAAALAAISLACIESGAAFSLQLSDGFQARVSIATSCLVTANDLNFGSVGTIFGGEAANATIAVNCSSGTPYTLSFNAFSPITSYSGAMVNGVGSVAYSASLSSAGGIGPGTAAIAGTLLPQATPAAGIYTDNRTVYLTY